MNYDTYFNAFEHYFWQWEDGGEVITIPGGKTIAYKEYIKEVVELLAPQGLPPFGSLLLAVVATNRDGVDSIGAIYSMLKSDKEPVKSILSDAVNFLKMLSEVPQAYKEGKKRIQLLQVLFRDCHNGYSIKKSQKLCKELDADRSYIDLPINCDSVPEALFKKDFRTISLLNNKFSSVKVLIERIAGLPELPDEPELPETDDIPGSGEMDFIDELVDNSRTFYVGSLIKRIWTGLNVPVHAAMPSTQALGGVSDLTNKGDFDKLLISEFANDDIVFLSRLANNEALYLHREVPPSQNNLKRIILIDVSLKNWGTPKTIAYAVMLAIAKHPKTDIECIAYAVGDTYTQIKIDTVDDIINALQILKGCLHSADGMTAFLDEYHDTANNEIFVITEASVTKQLEMLKMMHEYTSVNYWIFTDATGNIDVYKKQQNSKKHIQHIQLPLEELWEKPKKNGSAPKKKAVGDYPILWRTPMKYKTVLPAADGEVFMITHGNSIFKLYDKTASTYDKGWDLINDALPEGNIFEIGAVGNGQHVLLIYDQANKKISLVDLEIREEIKFDFPDWQSFGYPHFVFHEGAFYHRNSRGCWRIGIDGEIEKNAQNVILSVFNKRRDELNAVATKYHYTQQTLKNITRLFINETGNLVFNVHELHIKGSHLMMYKTGFERCEIEAEKSDNIFSFPDGSVAEMVKHGLVILKSSNPGIPHIFIPSVLNTPLGVVADEIFSGWEYYNKSLKSIHINDFYRKYINEFITHIKTSA